MKITLKKWSFFCNNVVPCRVQQHTILGYPTGYSQHNTPNKW